MENKIKIISKPDKENPFLVIYKPQNLASAPLNENDKENALSMAVELFPEIKNVKGKKEVEYGLVHRIDTVTDGLLLIAVNQDFYDDILRQQSEGKFIKYYRSECDLVKNICELKNGFPEKNDVLQMLESSDSFSIEVKSTFRPFGPGRKEVRPVSENSNTASLKKAGNKIYSTLINVQKKDGLIKAVSKIDSGYRHQVRCHLAWCGIPCKGDKIYNPVAFENEFKFTAFKIEFINSVTGKKCTFEI